MKKRILLLLTIIMTALLIFSCNPETKSHTVKLAWLNGKTDEIVVKESSYTLPSAKSESSEYSENDYLWTLNGQDYESGSSITLNSDIVLYQKCTVSAAWNGEDTAIDSIKAKLINDGEGKITFKNVDDSGNEKEEIYTRNFYHIDIDNASDFSSIMKNINDLGNACYVINLKNSIELSNKSWTPTTLSGYDMSKLKGCSVVINGNGYSIYNLSIETNGYSALIGGVWSEVQLEINDLTISNATIKAGKDKDGALYYASGFVGSVDSASSVKLKNCTLKNSKIESGKYAGAFMAYNCGFDKLTNGAIKTRVDFISCSVLDSSIKAEGSVGGIIGHAGANPFTYNTIENCIVKNTEITSTDTDDNKAGAIVGTAHVGEVIIDNAKYNENVTVISNTTQIKDRCYGRFVPGSSGKLTIDGVSVTN